MAKKECYNCKHSHIDNYLAMNNGYEAVYTVACDEGNKCSGSCDKWQTGNPWAKIEEDIKPKPKQKQSSLFF